MTKKEYADLLKHPLWQKRRLEIMSKAGFKCELCGNGDEQLHIHHTEYIRGRKPWEHPDDVLQCLCETHHEQAHSGDKPKKSEEKKSLDVHPEFKDAAQNSLPTLPIERSTRGLRSYLFDVLQRLHEGSITPQDAKAIASLSQQIHNTTRIELDAARFLSDQRAVLANDTDMQLKLLKL